MKIEELSRKNACLTYEIQNVLSEIILTYIMDVDFISKDGVACHNTKDYVVFLKFFIYCTFWSFGNVCQILGLWRGALFSMYVSRGGCVYHYSVVK